ncbi:hypothetical protein PGRAN_02600 [Listeria grandensis FSL F6-0971]|uniref:Uncharacterized protein n=1 Tax=Listeria grandensis FSL F6-0971 TaxID=1265819 RepID=W7BCA8_9LIST|nr:hypothetical protein PGRAN_02600 [Listeria grandensis FSL F6-0971]
MMCNHETADRKAILEFGESTVVLHGWMFVPTPQPFSASRSIMYPVLRGYTIAEITYLNGPFEGREESVRCSEVLCDADGAFEVRRGREVIMKRIEGVNQL